MIQIYADDVLTFDSRLEDYDLLRLPVTTALNKGGTAEIVMPPGHPAYSAYTEYRTIVRILRDNAILWRGRALYVADDFQKLRTVVCEGELCFFQDAISRPYLYRDSPAVIFAAIVQDYNTQVEEQKQFQVGEVTVTDPNDFIRLESESAEPTLDTLNKLISRCGGYIIFTTNEAGQRVINWYAELEHHSSQAVDMDLGGNLLSFARNGVNTSLATALVPYGAKDETTGKRVTIESVNDGLDYIVDVAAEALRGRITTTVTWDDVTKPSNLLRKARQYLAEHRQIVTSLELTALDLSYVDKSIDSYRVGDIIHVRSKPHGVDDDFLLTERTEDLLNPAGSRITLGKEQMSLTGADVAGDAQASTGIQKAEQQITTLYQQGIPAVIEEAKETLVSLIQQTSEEITLEVSRKYATNDRVADLATLIQQTSEAITLEVSQKYATNERVTNLATLIQQTSEAITLEVSQKYATNERVTDLVTLIQQTSEAITLEVAQTYATNDRVTDLASLIQQTGEAITLEVAQKYATNDRVTDLTSLIQQTGEAITLEVAQTYATNASVTDLVSTSMQQLADSFEFLFTEMQTKVDENDAERREQIKTIERYIRFEDGNILLGDSGNQLTLRIENDRISFIEAGAEVAYFSDRHLVVLDGHFLNSLRVGSFAWLPRENGNLSLVKVGD